MHVLRTKTAKVFTGLVVLVIAGAFLNPLATFSQTNPLPDNREQLLALIQLLIARVAELQAQIAARGAASSVGYTFTRDLTVGSTGQDVRALQIFLSTKGFMTLPALPSGTNATFGPLTQGALTSFQRARGITPAAGFFGPTTRATVNQEAATIAFNFGGITGSTIAGSGSTQYGVGGSGNAPTIRRRSSGRVVHGSTISNNSNTTQTNNTGSGQCSDGLDNDSDGLIDFPIDPGCTSTGANEGSNPNVHVTYAYKHYGADGPLASVAQCTGSGTSYTCHPVSNFYNVIYPWVLDWRGDSLNVYKAKAYMDALPEGGRGMFSWVMDAANTSQENFYRDADNCKDSYPNGNTLTHTWLGPDPYGNGMVINNAGERAYVGDQIPYRCPWMDDWYSIIHDRWENFFRDYAAIGGKVDVVTDDNESVSGISAVDWTKINSILANPKFSQTSASNLPSSELAHGPMSSKLLGLNALLHDQTACDAVHCADQFSNFLYDWFASYLNAATYVPLHRYFPNAALSNFAFTAYDYDTYRAPLYNLLSSCIPGSYCSNMNIFGTHQQPGFMYGTDVYRPGMYFDNIHPYVNNSFNKLREEVDFGRISRLSDPSLGYAPLYANASRAASFPGLYAESIFHSLATGADFLQQWHDSPPVVSDERILSKAMAEFDQIAGYEDKHTLIFDDLDNINTHLTQADPSAWNDDYVLTGIRSGGRIVWRFTPQTGHTVEIPTVASTLVSTNPPTFRTAQVVIAFPEGKIYTPSDPQSNLGYWIVQPGNAAPPVFTDSSINAAPTASFYVWNKNIDSNAHYNVLLDATASYDPDGGAVTLAYDFDNDGVFGPHNLGDDINYLGGGSCHVEECNTLDPAQIGYRFTTAGPHTVTLRVTDGEGAVATYTKTFTIPDCTNPIDSFHGCNNIAAAGDFSSNLAQADAPLITQAISSFWQEFASLIYKFFAGIVHFFVPQ